MFIFSCLLSEIVQHSQRISENEKDLTERKSNLSEEEKQKKDLSDSIQRLKEELMKKEESK